MGNLGRFTVEDTLREELAGRAARKGPISRENAPDWGIFLPDYLNSYNHYFFSSTLTARTYRRYSRFYATNPIS